MTIYKVISLLLEYPKQELVDHWDEVQHSISEQTTISHEDKQVLNRFIDWASSLSLTKLQANYVDNFDLKAAHSLYLTYHLFDEQDRNRGPALIELSELYKSTGFEVGDGELPDYLPLILEYVATMEDESSAREFLQQTAQAVDIIASNLEKLDSPYAPLLRIVESHGLLTDIAA
ncbi:MAG: nitrate reductase molybdenum cofactor assembly chaperone [Methylococcaceae bacterium]|nr:nitrate reductase molybdenum cofactor assembly chaperone [Methylococcaceae bacterium]